MAASASAGVGSSVIASSSLSELVNDRHFPFWQAETFRSGKLAESAEPPVQQDGFGAAAGGAFRGLFVDAPLTFLESFVEAAELERGLSRQDAALEGQAEDGGAQQGHGG